MFTNKQIKKKFKGIELENIELDIGITFTGINEIKYISEYIYRTLNIKNYYELINDHLGLIKLSKEVDTLDNIILIYLLLKNQSYNVLLQLYSNDFEGKYNLYEISLYEFIEQIE